MNQQIKVSAPGKIHFLGEHVVVYGKPALLTAIDKRCIVSLISRDDKQVVIISKNFNKHISLTEKEIKEKQKQAVKKLEQFLHSNDVTVLSSLTKDPLDYVVIAIGEALKHYKKILSTGFSITIDSQIPVGSGLGSSAAIAVGIAGVIGLFLNKEINKQAIFDIAFATEEKKHGRPSGGDPATVLYGGLVWFRKETPDVKIIVPLSLSFPRSLAKNFMLIDSGRPSESTGEMIAFVKQFTENDPEYAREIFDIQENLTRDLVTSIKENDEKNLMRIIKQGERNLEKMGTVSPYVKKIIRTIEENGGVGKISGGGGKLLGTGILLVYHPQKENLKKMLQSQNLTIMQVVLGCEGLRIEK